jgi:response regulator RpfG family c-di-GMP phosphodiesterase
MQMPKMNGVEFLSNVRVTAPDTIRMMLTGFADLDTSIDAVNEGHIFRFLTKPCPTETLVKVLKDGVRQYHLVKSEKELLENTLSGSVKVMIEILSLTSPVAFGRANRVRATMIKLADKLKVVEKWEFVLAGMLSQIGCITLPSNVLEKIYKGFALNGLDTGMFAAHPKTAHDLIVNIPRLNSVAQIILWQEQSFKRHEDCMDGPVGSAIPLGARALHIALDYDTLTSSGKTDRHALRMLANRTNEYDPHIVKIMVEMVKGETEYVIETIKIKDLESGMKLAEDIKSVEGTFLVAKGQPVSLALKERLRNFSKSGEVPDTVDVFIPSKDDIF